MTTFFDGSPRLTLEPRLLDCPSCGHDHSVKSRDVSEGDYTYAVPGHSDICDCGDELVCARCFGIPGDLCERERCDDPRLG